MPANAVVRPARNACTPRRRPTSACRIDSSAVRCAWSDVSPNVRPSTTTTSSVAAKKILAARPPRHGAGLIPLACGIRWIVVAVLVLVGEPAEAPGVELDLEIADAGGPDHERACHTRSVYRPGGTSSSVKLPSAPGWVYWRVGITCTNATMRGWTLQNTRTSPRVVKVHALASPRPYWPRSKCAPSLTEKTL